MAVNGTERPYTSGAVNKAWVEGLGGREEGRERGKEGREGKGEGGRGKEERGGRGRERGSWYM